MKTKLLMPVLAALLVFGVANTAFAQLTCSVTSAPISRATDTGHTEPVGDLAFDCQPSVTNETTGVATITVTYGVVITSSVTHPSGKPIALVATDGSFDVTGPTITSVDNTNGIIIISVPGQLSPAAGSFTLTGVLASLAGSGKTVLSATVLSTAGSNLSIPAGQNNPTVISSILPGLKTPALTTPGIPSSSGTVMSSGNIVTPGFSINIQENYIDMFQSEAQFNSRFVPGVDPTAGFSTNGTEILLTLAGIPAGVTLGGCSANSFNSATAAVPLAISSTSFTSVANTVSISWPDDAVVSPVVLDTVTFACTTFTVGSGATLPLTAGNITATATLAPTGAPLGTGNTVLTATGGEIPRYAATPLPSPAMPVITIVAAQTNFLIPYAISELTYDTGIAVSNTTADPFGIGGGGARPQDGTITFTLYPRTGAPCTITPSTATVGVGLSSTGVLVSGRTYTVLLSELIAAGTSCATNFTGYIFGVANFTNAHGSAFVSDFKSFTSYTNMLILPPAALSSRAASFTEVLGH